MWLIRMTVLAWCVLVGAGAWAHDQVEASLPYFPSAYVWEWSDPASVGMDPFALRRAADLAAEHQSDALIVLKHGRIVLEQYWNNRSADRATPIYSATKSIVSLLVGIAQGQGAIRDLHQPTADFIVEWKGTPYESITLWHHLTMTAGLDRLRPQRRPDGRRMPLHEDRQTLVTLLRIAQPGTQWAYNTQAYRLLLDVLKEATGQPLEAYSQAVLFEPIEARSATWVGRAGSTSSDAVWLAISARDLARLGLLVLRQGRWGDQQVVPASYIAQAIQPATPLNESYGYLFWTNAGDTFCISDGQSLIQEPLYPRAPRDTIAVLGVADTFMWIIPSQDLVVVRMGKAAGSNQSPVYSRFGRQLLKRVCQACGIDTDLPSEAGQHKAQLGE